MDSHETSPDAPSALPHARVWQDTAAESLLAVTVGVIALTGNDSLVLRLNVWLASAIPAYDPMVTMLALVIVVIAALVMGSVGLKVSARRANEGKLRPASSRRAQPRRTLPSLES
jgi:hypothetical protein